MRGEDFEEYFLHNIKPSSFGELKNCIGDRFWRVYTDSSNLINVVMLFLELKI